MPALLKGHVYMSSRSFDQLANISPNNHIYPETFYSEFSYIEVRFTDQNSAPRQIKPRIN